MWLLIDCADNSNDEERSDDEEKSTSKGKTPLLSITSLELPDLAPRRKAHCVPVRRVRTSIRRTRPPAPCASPEDQNIACAGLALTARKWTWGLSSSRDSTAGRASTSQQVNRVGGGGKYRLVYGKWTEYRWTFSSWAEYRLATHNRTDQPLAREQPSIQGVSCEPWKTSGHCSLDQNKRKVQ